MVGSLFLTLKKFVEDEHGVAAWLDMLEKAGIPGKVFMVMGNYPAPEMIRLLEAGALHTGVTRPVFEARYGEVLASLLLKMYASLVRPEWKTEDLLLHTEDTIHKVVRSKDPQARPAALQCRRLEPGIFELEYRSENGLHHLAAGIVRGIAAHYQEEAAVSFREIHAGGALIHIELRPLPSNA